MAAGPNHIAGRWAERCSTSAWQVGLDPLNFVDRFKEGVTFKVPAMNTVKRGPADDSFTSLKKVTEYKLLLNDKGVLFEEMYSKALLLINRDQQIIKN